VVVVDPISNVMSIGALSEVRIMLVRLIDFLKSRVTTGIFTSLTAAGDSLEQTEVGVSSLIDTWLLLRFIEVGGERNRGLHVLKSRGMPHSNQVREFVMSDRGIELIDVYAGPSGVLTGAARRAQEARERSEAVARRQEIERKQRELERKRELLAVQMAAMRAEFEAEEHEIQAIIRQEQEREASLLRDRSEMARLRQAEASRGEAHGVRSNGEAE
jgi:circadian clock protein KaiC